VATDLTREQLRQLARLGAVRRLEEIREEEAAIRAAFPDLIESGRGRRRGRRRGRPPGTSSGAGGTVGAKRGRRRRRRKMSTAERRAVSERMRKYWAERRKAKG